ncbi:MAG: chalcone isomerase family protein [Gammaproteobacteria bacterium]
MRLIISLFFILLVFTTPGIADSEQASPDMPENMTIDDQPLLLNGAGLRKKFFIKVYRAGLYLPERSTSTDIISNMPGAKNVRMNILHSKIAAKKSRTAWTDGLKKNLSETDFAANKAALDQFNALFPDLHKGDQLDITFHPGNGTTITLNNSLLGTVAGDQFYSALLQIWLGDKPADNNLKQAWLGQR